MLQWNIALLYHRYVRFSLTAYKWQRGKMPCERETLCPGARHK
jgi:hypothetical protein